MKTITPITREDDQQCIPCWMEELRRVPAVIEIRDAQDEEAWPRYMCGNHAETLDIETYSAVYDPGDPRRAENKRASL